MDLLISTASLIPRSFSDAAYIARTVGADGLEIVLNRHLLAVGPHLAAETAAEHGVPIRSIHPSLHMHARPEVVRDDMIAAATYAAAIPGCRTVVMHSVGGAGLHTTTGRAFLDTVNDVCNILAPSDARLTIENRGTLHPQPKPDFLDRLLNLYRVCEEWELGITFDTAHAASYGLHIVTSLDIIFPRLRTVHFSDRREDPPFVASSFVNALTREHQLPGTGILPLEWMLQRLNAKRYAGAITLELSPLAVQAWSAKRAVTRLTQTVAFMREHTAVSQHPATPTDHTPERQPRPDRLNSEP